MKKNLKRSKYFIILSYFLLCSCHKREAQPVIAAASSMQFVMEELISEFKKKTGIECTLVLSSSGKLTTQISQGAPYDLFISADTNYTQQLYQKKLTSLSPRKIADGVLVLYTAKFSKPISLQNILTEEINYVAIANPSTAPYGVAAEQLLKKAGLYQEVQKKLVFGESISQVNQFIQTKSAEVGFTAKSVVVTSLFGEEGHWVNMPVDLYEPITHTVVLLKKNSDTRIQAEYFYDFLFSEDAKTILNTFGYLTEY